MSEDLRTFASTFKTKLTDQIKIYCGVEQLVARRAHNPEVIGSSPVPATYLNVKSLYIKTYRLFYFIIFTFSLPLCVYLLVRQVESPILPDFENIQVFLHDLCLVLQQV